MLQWQCLLIHLSPPPRASPWVPPCLQHRPWILAAYGMWACHCALGTRGTAMVLLHTTISFCVAQFRSLALSWLCSLFLLSTLRLQDVEEVKVSVSMPTGKEMAPLPMPTSKGTPLFSDESPLKNCGGAPPSGHGGLMHVNPALHLAVLSFVSDCVSALGGGPVLTLYLVS